MRSPPAAAGCPSPSPAAAPNRQHTDAAAGMAPLLPPYLAACGALALALVLYTRLVITPALAKFA